MTRRIHVAVPKGADQEHAETADGSNALPCADTLDAGMTHGRSDVEPPLKSPVEEVTRLRDTLNELRGIMARSALWTGGDRKITDPLIVQQIRRL